MRKNRRKVGRRVLGLLVVGVLVLIRLLRGGSSSGPADPPSPARRPPAASSERQGEEAVLEAFRARRSDVLVNGAGRVTKTLPDDVEGDRHQRFILELPSGHTVLVAHNIDTAPRVPLDEGDTVSFQGEYVWNGQGGVVHWTHRDRNGRHAGGWLRHDGKSYQ